MFKAVCINRIIKIFKSVSPDFFDLIVIDECHRGSAAEDSSWREILDYFKNAVQIGLTATPKETEYVSNLTKTLWIVGIILFTILYEHSKTVEKFFKPAFSFIQYVIAIPLDIVFLFMKKKDVAKK